MFLVALWVWKEPLEILYLQRRPIAEFQQYVAQNPHSADAARALALRYLQAARPKVAAALLTPLIETAPADAGIRTLLARASLEAGNVGDAYAHLQVVLHQLKPNDPEAEWWLGQTLERMSRTDAAYDQYTALVKQQPRHVGALIRLGHLAATDGRLTAAEEFFHRAVTLDPRNAEAGGQWAQMLFRIGRTQEAAAAARAALAVAPSDARANFWLGRSILVLDARGSGKEAETAFRKEIASGEDPDQARYYLAKLYREQGRLPEAVQELQEATRENPLQKDAFYDLAQIERSLGHKAEAEAAMQRSRALQAEDTIGGELEYRVWSDPENPAARRTLAHFYLGHRRPDLAMEQIKELLKQHPNDPEGLRLKAQASAPGSAPR